jgi:AraC-like DNA-binding protein
MSTVANQPSATVENTASSSALLNLRYSTDTLPEQDRLPYWREVFGRGVARVEIEPITNTEPFHASLVLTSLPDCRLMLGNNSDLRFLRTPDLISKSNDDLGVTILMNEAAAVSQCGHESVLEQGDATLLSQSELGFLNGSTRFFNIRMPLQRMKSMVPHIEDRLAERIPRETPALRLLTSYMETEIWQRGELCVTPELSETFAGHLRDLVALVFNAKGEVAEQARQGGLRAARLAEIRREIKRSALDPDFSLPELALRIGVTPRYVQMLMKEQGSSFIKEITECRLERARRLLRSPQWQRISIAEIAHQCGFASVEHFHRLFRSHAGVTPGDMRAEAAAAHALKLR